jgi:hypothetical protein
MTVDRRGSYKISPNHELYNNHIYSGNENMMIMSRVYYVEFLCEFYMEYYPFDSQHCNMTFILQVLNKTHSSPFCFRPVSNINTKSLGTTFSPPTLTKHPTGYFVEFSFKRSSMIHIMPNDTWHYHM